MICPINDYATESEKKSCDVSFELSYDYIIRKRISNQRRRATDKRTIKVVRNKATKKNQKLETIKSETILFHLNSV